MAEDESAMLLFSSDCRGHNTNLLPKRVTVLDRADGRTGADGRSATDAAFPSGMRGGEDALSAALGVPVLAPVVCSGGRFWSCWTRGC
jgi:hypothetical protein